MPINPNISDSRPARLKYPGPTPFVDYTGADTIRRLREDAGKSWHGLATAIKCAAVQHGWLHSGGHGTVTSDTIRRIEEGHVPSLRVQVVLALYFRTDRREIWKPENRRSVLREHEVVA